MNARLTSNLGFLLKGLLLTVLLVSTAALAACEGSEAQRFRDQEEWYRFDGQPLVVEFQGARLRQTTPEVEPFECPAEDTIVTELAVFDVDATTPAPAIDIELPADFGARCDDVSTDIYGIELRGLPLDAVDIFERCDPSADEAFVSNCNCVVDSCDDTSRCARIENACVRRVEGRYRLMAWSEYSDDERCVLSDVERREPYLGDPPEACVACDAFSPIPITAAVRGTQSVSTNTEVCSSEEVEPLHLAFCARQCNCRTVRYQLVPKGPPPGETLPAEDTQLRIAVVSDVEGNKSALRNMVQAALERDVDMVVNIGDLTTGGQAEMNDMAEFTEELFVPPEEEVCLPFADGRESSNCYCQGREENIPVFLNGLGENETDENSFFTFFQNFGPSNFTATVGGVQLIMVDSADATLSQPQFNWLEDLLDFTLPSNISCSIPVEPPNGDHWPVLANPEDCEEGATCIECLGATAATGAICVPPPRSQDYLRQLIITGDANRAPLNCMCLPNQSEPCPNNFSCVGDSCACSRDEDCGPGAACVSGDCEPPLRLFFTHTPPFDTFGARNNAFRSRREAAQLLALLSREGVDFIFAGSINSFAEISVAGIPAIVTGGGGAPLEAFDDVGLHFVLVTVDNAYDRPTAADVSVEVVTFND